MQVCRAIGEKSGAENCRKWIETEIEDDTKWRKINETSTTPSGGIEALFSTKNNLRATLFNYWPKVKPNISPPPCTELPKDKLQIGIARYFLYLVICLRY